MSNDLPTPTPFHGWVAPGFPSPAADSIESALDLNELYVDQAVEDAIGRVVIATLSMLPLPSRV